MVLKLCMRDARRSLDDGAEVTVCKNKGGVLMRRGFSLIIAIIFLVLVATIGMFSLNTSAVTAKQTTDIFLREQADLLAQSATEVAILNLLQRNFSTDCPITAGNEIIIDKQPFPDAANTLFNVTVRIDRLFEIGRAHV